MTWMAEGEYRARNVSQPFDRWCRNFATLEHLNRADSVRTVLPASISRRLPVRRFDGVYFAPTPPGRFRWRLFRTDSTWAVWMAFISRRLHLRGLDGVYFAPTPSARFGWRLLRADSTWVV